MDEITVIANVGAKQIEKQFASINEFIAKMWCGELFYEQRTETALELAQKFLETRNLVGQNLDGLKFTSTEIEVEIIV